MIRSVIFTDAGVYTCTNERSGEQFSEGGPAIVNVTITRDAGVLCVCVCACVRACVILIHVMCLHTQTISQHKLKCNI